MLGVLLLTKFKNGIIELGNDITEKDFVRYGLVSNVRVDLSKVKKDEVGIYDVKVKYLFFDYDLKVQIHDTTPPELQLKDVYQSLGYEIDVQDFISKLEDKSEVSVKLLNVPKISDYGDYKIKIMAQDMYGNKTEKECTLFISSSHGELILK